MSPSPTAWCKPLILILPASLLAACATFANHDVPGCSGARRPANPYGSVLGPGAGAEAPPALAGACRGARP
jgi:hypothetical protein